MAQHTFPALDTNNVFSGNDNFTGGLQINGTTLGTPTGSGAVVLATSPTIAGVTLTGTSVAPTPTLGDDSTQIATTDFVAKNAMLQSRFARLTTQVTNTGNTNVNTVYSLSVPFAALATASSVFRITIMYTVNPWTSGTDELRVHLGAQTLGPGTDVYQTSSFVGQVLVRLTGVNANATNSQIWMIEAMDQNGFHFQQPAAPTTVDTTSNQTLTVLAKNGNSANVLTFNGVLFEIL